VIHRVDIHSSLLEGAVETGRVEFFTNTRIEKIEQDDARKTVTAIDQNGKRWVGQALIGADGGKSVVRAQYVNDPPRVTGHVVYRAVVDKADFPDDLKWNAASLWAGPKCHLVHYPLRGGEQYNVVVTFHSRQQEQWGVTDGSKEEVESYFQGICPKARQLIELPKTWRRWATADKEPIGTWVFGRATILGDAAHPTTQYMAQGACMAMEDAVTLGEALRVTNKDWDAALAALPEKPRHPHRAHRAVRPGDGAPVPRHGRGAADPQLAVERPQPGAFLRRHRMAVRLEREQLSRPRSGLTAASPVRGQRQRPGKAGSAAFLARRSGPPFLSPSLTTLHPPETPHARPWPPGRPAAGLPRRTHETQPGAAVAQPARGAAARRAHAQDQAHLLGLPARCARC
jgi:2-polyprenyl-6-methoxyphenol hydroxylase-like FAD-dependent oxidoreductase